ncbi:uncharacterized protein LOC143555300 [Bidens hawaiensis]|uniref:uncharacterized protein LOC143555300 n=1 Tax=Bidens hawaiensis TaxID=980011 RepID=UPI00404B7FB0
MYQDLKKNYLWLGMKQEMTDYASKCLTCLQVKAEHQKPYGKIEPLEMPKWKWEHLTMDFITKLPRTAKGYDTIWVVVIRLTKSARFLPISETHTSEKLAELFIKEIVARHGMPVSIVSGQDTQFTSSLEVVELTTEKLDKIKAFMKTSQDRQKSYADKRHRPTEFEAGDHVLLNVSLWKGINRFRKWGKLSPRFIGRFNIVARVGEVSYRKCLAYAEAYVPLKDIQIDDKLNYIEEPVAILDQKEKQLRNKTVKQVKVQWKYRKRSEATWEFENEMSKNYPQLFSLRQA